MVTDRTVEGTATGGSDSGPDAVMAFETAYYTKRSGAATRAVTTPDAQVPAAAAVIQAGIGSIPPGSEFCVVVSPAGTDAWHVDVTETRSTRPPTLYRQMVTTVSVDGRVLITGISQR
ncbi:hypothetical protein AWN90_19330 [Nocardia terpenica]|uniref:DUF8176 domain-containing protein n=1 Tax=Nocardia terpenica TaxID=455432 RepID=A0A164PGA0_9NOCA|nr:hypothetical protein AWN90_19330 [Nocardia terpenica]